MEMRSGSLPPSSCDTFVALPPATKNGTIIFGKNSDRPAGEVQEVVYHPATDYGPGTKLQCTYIEIDQCSHTHSVILSKPAWMWGGEMGANQHGVCIGNEAIWTKLGGPEDLEEKLLGMDYVRLGLERGQSAKEAMGVITGLLEQHGQGGPCYEDPDKTDVSYHNSFIITDQQEAWVLETASKHWAAQRIKDGVRNISNQLSIGTEIDEMSAGLKEHAESNGYWNPADGDFDFAKAYQGETPVGSLPERELPENRFKGGRKLLDQFSEGGGFSVQSMMSILRDDEQGICRTGLTSSTMGSQVSVLSAAADTPDCHWFTATPNPRCSVFKPFIFCPGVATGANTTSPDYGDADPAKVTPRFQSAVDRRHKLYSMHEKFLLQMKENNAKNHGLIISTLANLEEQCVADIDQFLEGSTKDNLEEVQELFKDIVETEIKFYV